MNKSNNFKEYFEANLLDGDDVKHCGKAMLDANDVYEVISEYLASKQKEIVEALANSKIKSIENTPYRINDINTGWNAAMDDAQLIVKEKLQ